ncbi:MFS transporter [Paraburkholderia pallida]|uniref:MFS transporter n=2 Tax=Paraburkholderia pallida TaxID=2547399 RepID=A0A4P7D6U4_9BURK|nr:MFS transporter [Paraburkholderia pallida]
MTGMQWLIWTLAAFGKFFEGFVVFMGGVTVPLITRQFHLDASQAGLVTSASLAGILVGTILLGGLSDYFGRKRMFIAEMIIFCLFLALLIMVGNFLSLVICLFGVGMALGCDYPTAHMIISESIPSASRGRLVLGAFAFQAIGAMSGIMVGAVVLMVYPSLDAWRWMYATALVPAILITVGRFFITESANWLAIRGHHEKAEEAVARLLHRTPAYPAKIALKRHEAASHAARKPTLLALFKGKNLRATLFSSLPWLLQDLGTYGIGVFTPTMIATALGKGPDKIRSPADLIASGIHSAQAAALTTSLLIVGIIFAIALSDKLGRIKLQIFGFIGCAVGLAIASMSIGAPEALRLNLIMAGVMLFNFMTNLGPNAQTYLLAGEVFPTEVRGMGAGFAAMIGKVGAVATTYGFPLLLVSIGTKSLLYGLVISALLGAVVTWVFRIETNGVNLDSIGH